ncbi:hypothetical protein ACFOD4_13915 [Pseudoroseomonas globiformis]|uniref:Uncharacterized protein n=1 Tax=Teichococcus globiformis TaxID=2307229 RepID=A0ABV7G4P1_9PROT
MNLTQILDASALAVLAAQAGWIGLLYRRMGRLRTTLEGAGAVIGQLDTASRRLDDSAGGIVQKVRDGIAEVDSKIGACRRLSQELTTASRHAEEVATRLDQALRQNRRLQTARAAAPPRELAEPLGLAERLAGREDRALPHASAIPPGRLVDVAPEPEEATIPSPEPAIALDVAPLLALAMKPHDVLPEPPSLGSVLAAELLFAERAAPVTGGLAGPVHGLAHRPDDPRTVRVKLD